MKHYFYLNFTSYDDEGEEVGGRGGFVDKDNYQLTKADIQKVMDSVPGETLHLVSVSYLGQMTQEEFEG